MPIDESQAYLTHPDGTKIQVLKDPVGIPQPDGTQIPFVEWDEAATHAAYADYVASKG
jgi:hypothetical protein